MNTKNLGKKIFVATVAIVLAIGISFVVAMLIHNTDTVSTSKTVENGLSAYELAVQYGYEGTVQEWLDSLQGKSAYDIAVENGYSGTEEDWTSSLKATAGKEGVGIKTAAFSSNNELLITLTDGTVLNLGVAEGMNGTDGKDGVAGTDGKDGANGKDGVGITAANINDDGQLVISFSDGKSVNLDKVVGMNGKDGISVSSSEINANGELVITYSNGQTANLGIVVGAKGDAGEQGIQGEKGDTGEQGVQGEQGIQGEKGDKGDTGATGVDGVSVTKTEINNKGELIITFSDNTISNLGVVVGAKGDKGDKGDTGEQGIQGEKGDAGAKGEKGDTGVDGKDGADGKDGVDGADGADGTDGVGIETIAIDNGNLKITLTNGTDLDLGNIKGADGIDGIDGKDGADGSDGKDGLGVQSTTINEYGELIISYTDGTSVNLGCVVGKDGADGTNGTDGKDGVDGQNGKDGADGEDGIGISKTEINDNGELVVTYTDNTTKNIGVVVGKDGVDGVDGKDGIDGQDGTKGDKGDTGADGVGVASIKLENDELIITLSDATVINLGNVKGTKGDKGDTGAAGHDGADGADGKDGVGISNVVLTEEGNLKVTFTTGTTIDLGNVKGADGRGVDEVKIENNILMIKYSDEDAFVELGNVKGEKGDTGEQGEQGPKGDKGDEGRGIVKTEISGTNLIIYYTDDTTEMHDLSGLTGDPNENSVLVFSILPDGTYGVMAGGMAKYEAVIEIPATYNGIAVTQILDDGFSGLSRLQEVIIPENITTVGNSAFYNCTSLTSVALPKSLRKIEAYAFYQSGLISATLHSPDSWHATGTLTSNTTVYSEFFTDGTVDLKDSDSYTYNGCQYFVEFTCNISEQNIAATALTEEWSDEVTWYYYYNTSNQKARTGTISVQYYSCDWIFEE